MSLTVNWQQGITAQSPFANGLGSTDKVGKLNTTSATHVKESTIDKADAVSTTTNISMGDFLSTLRDNLLNLEMKDSYGKAKDVEPLITAFESTINQLEEAFGKGVAEMAMNTIAQGIESGGASDANMTNVLSSIFNEIALDPTLKGKHIELTERMTGIGSTENDDWVSQGLTRMLNSGRLTKALSDFYLTEQDGSLSSKKFTLDWSKQAQAYGLKLITENYYNGEIKNGMEGDTENSEALTALHYPPEAYIDGRIYGDLKSEWYVATKLASFMAQNNPDQARGNFMDTIEGIINGSIKSEKSNHILQAEDLYSKFVEDKNRALEAINEFRSNHKNAFGAQITSTSLTESELTEYNALNEKWSNIHQEYNQKSNELYSKILAEVK